MNWIDETAKEFTTMTANLICYECIDNDLDVEMIQDAQKDWLRTALTEAHAKGYEEGRVASLANIIPETMALAHTKGAQEALAKVEEWVSERKMLTYNLSERGTLYDLLHHLQQLKDNKTV